MKETLIARLQEGNLRWQQRQDEQTAMRRKTAAEGQQPYAIVIACSDSRVIPEVLFDATLGELFVIRVAGNVLADQQLGSIQYAVEHLGCPLVVMLGHTGCGAIGAALEGHAHGYICSIVDGILQAVGTEKDPDKACRLNVLHGVDRIRAALPEADVRGAVYDIQSGAVEWL